MHRALTFFQRSSNAKRSHISSLGLQAWKPCQPSRILKTAPDSRPRPEVLSLDKLEEIFPAAHHQLANRGFAIIDEVFGHQRADALSAEVRALKQDHNIMRLNSTVLVRAETRSLLEKRGVWEAELQESATQAAAPLLGALQQSAQLRTLLSVYMPQLALTSQAIKAQFNEGSGACFPMHVDSDEQVDGRRLSAIFYLNKNWQPEHGGVLRLFPYGKQPVDIAPLHDRMVLFASTTMVHRVLPALEERLCFTLWMSDKWGPHMRRKAGSSVSKLLQDAQQAATAAGGALPATSAQQLLRRPDVQLLALKLQWADAWAESIAESHEDSAPRRAALEQFWADQKVIESAMQPLLPFLDRRDAPNKIQLL